MTNISVLWKQLSEKKEITSADMAALCLLKALKKENPESAKMFLKQAFSPITNATKLANGMYPHYAMWLSLCGVNSSHVAAWLTTEEQANLNELANSLKNGYGEVKL